MKSIKAKIIYYNIIKPTFDLIELFSINPGESVYNSVNYTSNSVWNLSYSVYNSAKYSVWISNSVNKSVYNSVRNSVRDNIK